MSTKTTTLAELTDLVLRFRDARDWRQFHTPKELAIDLSVEANELLEHMLWRNGPELQEHLARKREDVADELSDVLHVVLLLASDLDIDLADAFRKKMAKNAAKYPVEKARGKATKYNEL